jgi:hypothetical protein
MCVCVCLTVVVFCLWVLFVCVCVCVSRRAEMYSTVRQAKYIAESGRSPVGGVAGRWIFPWAHCKQERDGD